MQFSNFESLKTVLSVVFRGDMTALDEFCHSIDLNPERLHHPTGHYGSDLADRYWPALAQVAGSPHPGMVIGQQMALVGGGMVNHLMRVSPDLRTAVHHVCQYHNTFANRDCYDTFGVREEKDMTVFEIVHAGLDFRLYPYACQQDVELIFTALIVSLSELVRRPVYPQRIEWMGPPPATTDLYDAIYRAPMTFRASGNRLYFRRQELSRPVLTYNQVLYTHFQQTIEKLLGESSQSFGDTVRQLMLRRLTNHQFVTAEDLSVHLNLSVRSFQRRLEAEGTTFLRIAEEARKEVALQLLRTGSHNISEIAYLMGYDEPSSFRRAFKRWTGQSPKSFHQTSRVTSMA